MDVCGDNHDEIVYTSRNCPLCETLEVNTELEGKVAEMEGEISDLKYEINNLQKDLSVKETT